LENNIKENNLKHTAVLFDLDGTLLNTLQDVADSVNYGLASLHFPQHPIPAYKTFIGEGRDVLVRRALPVEHRDDATAKKLLDMVNFYYAIHWADNTAPYPGIPQLLDDLTAKGIKITVLSNKADDLTNICVTKLLSRWHFALVAGSRPSVPNKPDPAGTIQLAKQLGIKPEKFLYLGDSDIDMKTAVGAGMYPVGAGWGFRSESELLAAGAKAVIKQPGELLRYL
jgi:phosphoglycolate phosphatase